MLILTVVFFTCYLARAVRGNLYKNLLLELSEEGVKKVRDSNYSPNAWLGWKLILMFVFTLIMTVAYVIYLIKSLYIDPFIYPTILMLLILIFDSIRNKQPKKKNTYDLSTEEGVMLYKQQIEKVSKVSFLRLLSLLINIIYFAYMFYILVF